MELKTERLKIRGWRDADLIPFPFTPAISFIVHCDDQAEIDRMWEKLVAGGRPSQCGWLSDQFGVSWQIVPRVVAEMMKDQDSKKTERMMAALMKMVKLDIATLEKAFNG